MFSIWCCARLVGADPPPTEGAGARVQVMSVADITVRHNLVRCLGPDPDQGLRGLPAGAGRAEQSCQNTCMISMTVVGGTAPVHLRRGRRSACRSASSSRRARGPCCGRRSRRPAGRGVEVGGLQRVVDRTLARDEINTSAGQPPTRSDDMEGSGSAGCLRWPPHERSLACCVGTCSGG